MYGMEQYKTLLTKKFDDRDISWIKTVGLSQLKLVQEILNKEVPIWEERKDITFLSLSKEESTRRSFHYPTFRSHKSYDCHLTEPVRVDTTELDAALNKPFRLDVFIYSSFRSDLTRRFETKEKMMNYFEKLKKRVEEGFEESWRNLPEKISFLENELIRCNDLRNEKMKRRGTAK